MLIIGSHVNFTKKQLLSCVEQALEYKANTFMFYTGSNISTARSAIISDLTIEAHKLMIENNIDINNIVCHAPYLINLANPEKNEFGKSFLKGEMTRCKQLGITKLVLHPGAAGKQDKTFALEQIINCLNEVLTDEKDVCILLETMAGKGSECGCNIDEIVTIIKGVDNKECIGICLDTCHLNDAGYNIAEFDLLLDEIDEKVGLGFIKCVHLNDSKNLINSHKDRHANLGLGSIGFENLVNVVYNPRLENVSKILETPYITAIGSKDREFPPYKHEIEMIKSREFNEELENIIRSYYE